MSKSKVFRDPVHTNIEFDRDSDADSLVVRLVNSVPVQRLRHVRQLALANMVYHGAEHSRFSHSLGVCHLAKRLYAAASVNSAHPTDERELAVVLASAILHDTGHPPFSHAVEKILGVDHERVTVDILKGDTDVHDILRDFGGEEFVDDVAAHVNGESDAPTASIISSQLDADRLDYVLRDGYHAGVPNSQYDLERIVQLIHFHETGVVFDERARIAIEGYIISRYHLYLQLYFHKTNRAAEVILRTALKRAKDMADRGVDLQVDRTILALFTDGSTEASVALTDHDLWTAFRIWRTHDDPILSDLSRRLLERDLFKVIDVPASELPHLHERLDDVRGVVEEKGLDPSYYVAVDTAGDTPYKVVDVTAGDDPETSIRMFDAESNHYSLENRSGLVKQLQQEAYQKVRLCVPSEFRKDVASILER